MKPFEPAPPAKDMKVRLKHNEFRDLVNELRDTADRYGGTDQLRDQLAHTLARRVRPVPEIVEMRPVLERIDARLACDVLSASSTVEVLKLARDEIMVLAEEVMELRAALQHEADRVKAAKAEIEALRSKIEVMERQEPSHWAYQPEGFCVLGAQPAPSVPDGWLRAIDEALVTAHIGVANAEDTYEQAKAKLDNLIGFHVDVATDPAVNGGWKLVPIELTHEKGSPDKRV